MLDKPTPPVVSVAEVEALARLLDGGKLIAPKIQLRAAADTLRSLVQERQAADARITAAASAAVEKFRSEVVEKIGKMDVPVSAYLDGVAGEWRDAFAEAQCDVLCHPAPVVTAAEPPAEAPGAITLAAGQKWTSSEGKARRIISITHDGLVRFLLMPGGKVVRCVGHAVFHEWIARNDAKLEGVSAAAPAEPAGIDDVVGALRAIGWGNIAEEWETMQEVLALYANDEDRHHGGQGEAFGSIPTEAGIKARQHRAAFQRREAAADAR